jgi:hypothetical protein
MTLAVALTDVTLTDVTLTDVVQGPPVELREFEKELSRPLLRMDHVADTQTQHDIEDIITDALMRRSCNPIQIHLRLKKGFRPDAALTRSELDEMSSIWFYENPNKANKTNARQLAQFYVRIATIRARIMEELANMQTHTNTHTQEPHDAIIPARLQRAYAIQLQTMQTKQRENQDQLARILQTIILDPECIHPDLTDSDLDTLEQQVLDIAERGCASNQLRCVKIWEAAMEERLYTALRSELDALM